MRPLLKQVIEVHKKKPRLDQEEWIKCTLKSIGLLRFSALLSLLEQTYRSWSKSIMFGSLRLALIEGVTHLKGPERIGILMEAMDDLNPQVRKQAEAGLRSKSF